MIIELIMNLQKIIDNYQDIDNTLSMSKSEQQEKEKAI